MSDWQPIETAPMDGTPLLLFATFGRDHMAGWSMRTGAWRVPLLDSYADDPPQMTWEECWGRGHVFEDKFYIAGVEGLKVTHWHKLPRPPAGTEIPIWAESHYERSA